MTEESQTFGAAMVELRGALVLVFKWLVLIPVLGALALACGVGGFLGLAGIVRMLLSLVGVWPLESAS